jgi:transcription elongation factor Elf1
LTKQKRDRAGTHISPITEEATIDFEERPFTCPCCGRETVVALPSQMETILVGRETCEHCGREFRIENDVPMRLPS